MQYQANKSQKKRRKPRTREMLYRERKPRSPNGQRPSTINRKRNCLAIDFGPDEHGIRAELERIAKDQCRSVSSVVREILKRTLVDAPA